MRVQIITYCFSGSSKHRVLVFRRAEWISNQIGGYICCQKVRSWATLQNRHSHDCPTSLEIACIHCHRRVDRFATLKKLVIYTCQQLCQSNH